MEKTVKIGNKSVRLSNNVSWAIIYRDQFGRDIIPTLMPMFAGFLDVFSGIVNETGKTDEISVGDIARLADGESLINAMIHLGGLEFVDFINVTWAMAKSCDDDLPDPELMGELRHTFTSSPSRNGRIRNSRKRSKGS